MAKLASSSSSLALDVLRRLLCARTSNADAGSAPAPHLPPTPEQQDPRASPCIVARLMGLDAMPADAHPPPPLRRSRSASSAEGHPSPSPSPRLGDAAAARPRASKSLREKPAYLRQESDEFLLLSFSPEDHRDAEEELEFLLAAAGAATARRGGERTASRGATEQRRNNGRCRKLLFGDEEVRQVVPSPLSGRRRTAAECDGAQNASPVSVLEAHEESSTTTTSSSLEEVEHAEPSSATSVPVEEEAQFPLENRQSCRKEQLQVDYSREFSNSSPASNTRQGSRCSGSERRNRRVGNRSPEMITPDVAGIWQPVCRLVEDDLGAMEWPTRDGANVVAEMEAGILDLLICEIMGELVQETKSAHPFPRRSVSKKQMGGRDVQARRAVGCH